MLKTDALEMLDEYDFRGGRRGMYAERYAQGTNRVILSPDTAAVSPNSESVNDAFCVLMGDAWGGTKSRKPQQRED